MTAPNSLTTAAARLGVPADELSRVCRASGLSVEALEKLSAADREYWRRYARGEGPQIRNAGAITAQASAERLDALRKICALYGTPADLVKQFEGCGWPLKAIAQMLATATGEAKAIGPAGIGYCRFRLGQSRTGGAS